MDCLRIMELKDFQNHCRMKGLDEQEVLLADAIIREGIKGQELYDMFRGRWSVSTLKIKRRIIFAKLGINRY